MTMTEEVERPRGPRGPDDPLPRRPPGPRLRAGRPAPDDPPRRLRPARGPGRRAGRRQPLGRGAIRPVARLPPPLRRHPGDPQDGRLRPPGRPDRLLDRPRTPTARPRPSATPRPGASSARCSPSSPPTPCSSPRSRPSSTPPAGADSRTDPGGATDLLSPTRPSGNVASPGQAASSSRWMPRVDFVREGRLASQPQRQSPAAVEAGQDRRLVDPRLDPARPELV